MEARSAADDALLRPRQLHPAFGSTATAPRRASTAPGPRAPPRAAAHYSTGQVDSSHRRRLLRLSTRLLALLRASMRASAGAISIDWLRRRRRRVSAPALAAAARLNRARTGDPRLLQPPCPSHYAVNESCCALTYCNYRLQ